MRNPNFFEKFVTDIVSSIRASVNRYAYNRLQEDGHFDATDAYYSMQEYGGTLDEYVSNKFFGSLFSRKASF